MVDALYAAAKKVTDKYGDSIAANLAVFGAEVKLLGPDEYASYLKRQNQLFSSAIKSLN